MKSAIAMPASSMPVPSGLAGDLDEDERRLLRELVSAGPATGMQASTGVRSGLLGRIVGFDDVRAALEASGHVDQRRRDLPGEVTMAAVLNLGLYSGEGYDAVLARTFAQLPGPRAPGSGVPTGQALSPARVRLGEAPMRALFERTARTEPHAFPGVAGARAFGLEVNAIDGTTADLPSSGTCDIEFARPAGGKHPQARMVAVTTCATRRIRAAAIGSYTTGEQPLADQLLPAFGPGMLNLADRNFFSMARWVAFSATGAHLLWRVKNGKKTVPAKIIRRLPDGSYLVRLRESDNMWYRRRKAAGDPALPRLADTVARMVEFDLVVTDASGKSRTSRLRLLTTLLDPAVARATEIARAYAQRWQVELVFYRLKCTLRGNNVVLRGQTPALARQEIWALLIIYNALCDLAAHVAALEDIDPDEISFIAVIRQTRTHLAADTPCRHCQARPATPEQALNALVSDIAAHPRNRIGRNRVGPRTATQRRTGHGTTATYTINIAASNLPKAT